MDAGAALAQAVSMVNDGADILDIGGESTRPGAKPVDADTQVARVLPVIQALRAVIPSDRCLLSIDTTSSQVASAAVKAGVDIVNDVSAGTDDPAMLDMVRERALPLILMHRLGSSSETMQDNPNYDDVAREVIEYLKNRAASAERNGIPPEHIILDPGIGFGKRRDDNLELIARLDELVALGYPVLLGASRKRFMGSICQEENPQNLLGATVATTVWGVGKGARIFRVHDVKPNRQAADVTFNLMQHGR